MEFAPVGGIDPGLKGALVIADPLKVLDWKPMPIIEIPGKKSKIDIMTIKNFFRGVEHVFVEYVNGMPGRDKQGNAIKFGGASLFNFGHGYGEITGWGKTSGKYFKEVHSKTWKKYFSLPSDKEAAKQMAVVKASCDFMLPRCRTPHEGACEAYLIALYGAIKVMKGEAE
jgi:hypothetical protein